MNLRTQTRLAAIKDVVDDLGAIKDPKQRLDACNDLIEYIQIHFRDIAESDVAERERLREKARNARQGGGK